MNTFLLFLSASIIVVASLIGKLATLASSEKFLQRNISLLASFSAGVFVIAVVAGIGEAAHELSIGMALVAALIGFLSVTVISFLIPEAHHHHTDNSHSHNRVGVWKILYSDGLHNIVDGIALALAFSASTGLGIAMAVSIFAHEFVQELGEYFALRSYGLNQTQALWKNFIVACTIFIGIGIGFTIHGSEILEPWVLAISSGTFISVIVFDLIPQKLRSYHAISRHVLAGLLGAIMLLLINVLVPHSHEHDSEHNHADVDMVHDEHIDHDEHDHA